MARAAPEEAPTLAAIEPEIRNIDTGIKSAKGSAKPPSKIGKKPPSIKGYCWKSDSSGFACRKAEYFRDPDTGIKKRRLRRIGHLGKEAFAEMKKRYRGASLEREIAKWIEAHDRKANENREAEFGI